MITFNVLNRTFHLKLNDSFATGFVIDVKDKQYLVTAKHVVSEVTDSVVLELLHAGSWKNVTAKLVGHAPDGIDIAVLALPCLLAPRDLILKSDMGNIIIGQQAFFLGFPYGLFGSSGPLTNNFPVPFVKRATVSSVNNEANRITVYLDGHNNPGFSGGPVIFQEHEQGEFKVAAVVAGYRFEDKPVYQKGQALPLTYRYNTGIIISYGIKHAVDLVALNPIGMPTTSHS